MQGISRCVSSGHPTATTSPLRWTRIAVALPTQANSLWQPSRQHRAGMLVSRVHGRADYQPCHRWDLRSVPWSWLSPWPVVSER